MSKAILSRRALRMGLGRYVLMSHSEVESGGRQRLSILADAFEAVLGAIYLDAGFDAVRATVERALADRLDRPEALPLAKDPKTALQELLQGRGEALPAYVLESATGEPHEQVFSVRCSVQLEDGAVVAAAGVGSGRRRAEQEAAAAVLQQLTQRWQR